MTVECRKLRAPERETEQYTFTVAGRDVFPLDMLRYDRCYPKSQEDVAEVMKATNPRTGGPHEVTLVGPKAPTDGRWQSFGWVVVR